MTLASTLHDAFSAQAAATPGHTAVSCGNQRMSYEDLDRRSSQLARVLRAYGLPPEARIGLCADRGVDMVVGVLAILKSGGAYVPIDPVYPAQRIRYIVEDSAAPLIVSTASASASLAGCGVPIVAIGDRDDGCGGQADITCGPVSERSLAYVIYTSGSTGQPKGVMIEHRSVLRLIERTRGLFAFTDADVWTLFHSMSFDVSVFEMWGALLTGARLVVVPTPVLRVPEQLAALVDAERVTVLSQTPSAFRGFSEAYLRTARTTPLRVIVFAGEALSNRLLEPWTARYGDERPRLVNMYGITETTVHLTFHRVTAAQVREPHSFIGEPIDDMRIHLLDDRRLPVPALVPGRIYVSGPGLARGYLNRPALTAERFIETSAGDGDHARWYDSGDIAMRLETGALVYLRRADGQLKVRGYRIEPREVEACLEEVTSVACVVVAAEDFGGVTGLVAYVVARDATGDRDTENRISRALAARARQALPNHMRPSDYRFVTTVPLTTSGKIDRRALANAR
jgi:amino acid adenylation domain-containing protein